VTACGAQLKAAGRIASSALSRFVRTSALAALLTAAGACEASGQRSAWTLVWHDEFTGTAIDTTKWGFDLGNGFSADSGRTYISGWGNNELQCYTRAPANVAVSRGTLRIRALRGADSTCAFTSARLKTRRADGRALFATTYGRFEFRARLPLGKGLWPALWLLPQDEAYGTWAASGEIDVMEARGQTPATVLGTLHYGDRFPGNVHTGQDYVLPHDGMISTFHRYAVEWEPGRIRWEVDGVVTQEQTFWWSRGKAPVRPAVAAGDSTPHAPWPAPFDAPFYLVMNLAVGGNFLGNPDSTTPFPGEMAVDYVRVYARRGGYGRVLPRGPGQIPVVQR
jgi:beta-glucanase (GH16 family)